MTGSCRRKHPSRLRKWFARKAVQRLIRKRFSMPLTGEEMHLIVVALNNHRSCLDHNAKYQGLLDRLGKTREKIEKKRFRLDRILFHYYIIEKK